MGSPVMDEQSREQAKDSTPKPQPVVWSLEAGDVVQLVRTRPVTAEAAGSSPVVPAILSLQP